MPSKFDWSCEYEFSDLSIRLHGVDVGYFSGKADLAECRQYPGQFYVASVTLDGEKRTLRSKSLSLWKTEDAAVVLTRPNETTPALDTVMFQAIEAALYADREADECFQSEREDA